MASAVKVKSGFALAELDLDRRLKDEASYQQKLRNPATDRKARPALGAGLVDRPAQPGGARPPLSLALLAEVTASRQYHDLRPNLVRASAGRTGRRPIPSEGVAAGL